MTLMDELAGAELLDGQLPVATPTSYELLRMFTKRAKELGGRYVHRYPHARDTKFYFCANVEAFEQAAAELGLVVEVRSMSPMGITRHRNVYVKGLTLKGSKTK